MPFKITDQAIIIIKDLPVLQCLNCHEYLFEDEVMARVELILKQADTAAELESSDMRPSEETERTKRAG